MKVYTLNLYGNTDKLILEFEDKDNILGQRYEHQKQKAIDTGYPDWDIDEAYELGNMSLGHFVDMIVWYLDLNKGA